MIPLYSTTQIRNIDNFAINELGVPSTVLMENAAIQIYNVIENEILSVRKIKQVGAVCGKGNNGGDGFAVLRHFANKEYPIRVVHIGKEDEMSEDCKVNFRILKKMAESNPEIIIKEFGSLKDLSILAKSDIIFDSMLGSGAKGELREPYKEIVEALNKLKTIRIAVDIPTGLDADLGYGETVFNSDLTVTLGEFKKGLFVQDGYANCGKIIKGEIGIDPKFYENLQTEDFLIEPEDAFSFLPKKEKNAHKYSAGKVFTIAGSGSFPGAPVLTSMAVLKVGAGASILAFPKSIRNLVFKKSIGLVVQSYQDHKKEYLCEENINELIAKINWADVVAIGPGLGRNEETQDAVFRILKERKCKRCVIDADAIFALGNGRYEYVNLEDFVLTPHQGEFANLIGVDSNELRKNIFDYGRNFVARTGAYLVLKGAPTVIITPAGDALINSSGNPGMAKFGVGDVLTGVLAGIMSQQKDIEKSVVAGVYLHSLAADLLLKDKTEYAFTAEDIIKSLPSGFNFLRKTFA